VSTRLRSYGFSSLGTNHIRNKAAQSLLWDGFLAAWAEFDETAVIITPSA
jgi:hypothetical protein